MIKSLVTFGALLASSVSAVQKFSIPLPKPIILDQPNNATDIPTGFKASIDLAVL
jgi:hypothetical protein